MIEREIYFDFNSWDLRPGAAEVLDSVAELALNAKRYKMQLAGHADCVDDDVINILIAGERVKVVRSYLISRGLDLKSLDGRSFGKKQLKYTGEHKGLNRRVEISAQIWDPNVVKAAEEAYVTETALYEKLEQVKVGDHINLRNISFYQGRDILLPNGEEPLIELYTFLNDNPNVEIDIHGHVCCANNYPLSVDRASRVYHILYDKGIDKSRMRFSGFGNSKPIADEATEVGKQRNRRVEVLITKR